MAKKKKKEEKANTSEAIIESAELNEESVKETAESDVQKVDPADTQTVNEEQIADSEETSLQNEEQEEDEEDLTISPETIAEIGSPDKELVFQKVAKGYEEAKRRRENYKKIGPAFVFISAIVFLALMFTLDYKIAFLIIWVATTLYTAALMIRAEYKYNQFRRYLGLSDEADDADEESGEELPSENED